MMLRIFNLMLILVAVSSSMISGKLFAAFDQGAIFEVFSNSDGDAQYIELLTAADVNPELNNQSLISRDRQGNVFNSIQFPSDFTVDPSAFTFLMATETFVERTGLRADFLLPENFFPTDGGTIDLASGVATFTYQPGELPLNGLQSLSGSALPQIATPRNSAGQDAFVNLPINARYDPNAATLHLPVVSVPNIGVVNVMFDINLETLEFVPTSNFFVYQEGVNAGEAPALFRDDSSILVPRLVTGNEVFEFELSLLRAEPLTFGGLNIISSMSAVLNDTHVNP